MSARPFDVVILSSVEWDAAWQRHHAFAAQWARAGHRVFFVENLGFREPGLADLGRVAGRLRRVLRGGRAPGARPPQGTFIVSPLVLPPTRRLFRAANAAVLAPRLAGLLRARGLHGAPVVFAYLPTATTLALIDRLSPSLVVYDCVDNFRGLPSPPPGLAETEAALMARAGLVLTTSRTLYDDKKSLHPNVVELHHGAAPAFFLAAAPERPRRRLCYFGTLWRAVDYAPIRALAQAGFEIELIGPVKETPPPLPESATFRGAFPHEQLPALLADCDALLLPYVDDEYNRGVIPAKTYECLATGRPVLASPLPALAGLSRVLTICRGPQEWVAAARALSADSPAARRARVEEARSHGEEAAFARLNELVAAAPRAASPPLPAPRLFPSLSPVAAALALCALALPVSIAGSNIALALLALALLARSRRDGDRILRTWRAEPALAALALYAAAGLLAAALSGTPAASLRDAVKDWHRLWALGLFSAALALEPEAPLKPALGLSLGAMALYGIVQTAAGGAPDGALPRAHGFVHPVVFGEMMALAVLGGACSLLRPAPASPRRVGAAFAALVFAALLLSQTRMALIGAVIGFAFTALVEPRARRWAPPALVLVAAAAAAWELMPAGGRPLSSAFAPYDPRNPQQLRWVLWDVAARIFRDHPATGAGPGGYHRLFSAYHAGALDNEANWGSAHNLYLHQLAERGIAGGLALLALCGVLLARAARAARGNAGARALWSAGAVAAFLAMSMTETAFQNEQFAALLLLVWAWGTTSLRTPGEVL